MANVCNIGMVWSCRRVRHIRSFDEVDVDSTNVMTVKRFDASVFRMYSRYQRLAAEENPVEADRPHVIVDVGRRNAQHQILIVGGMGPLSDASISFAVSRVAATVSASVRLVVVSAPPPRTSVSKMPAYLKCVLADMREIVANTKPWQCYLASNTIHTVFRQTAFLVKLAVPTVHVNNLVRRSADYLVEEYSGKVDTILLLTTLVSWRDGLYVSLLTPAFAVVTADAAEINTIQESVESGKAGRPDIQPIARYIRRKLSKVPDGSRVLIYMGCTDFAFLVPQKASLATCLRSHFPGTRVEDTDKLFSKIITQTFQ